MPAPPDASISARRRSRPRRGCRTDLPPCHTWRTLDGWADTHWLAHVSTDRLNEATGACSARMHEGRSRHIRAPSEAAAEDAGQSCDGARAPKRAASTASLLTAPPLCPSSPLPYKCGGLFRLHVSLPSRSRWVPPFSDTIRWPVAHTDPEPRLHWPHTPACDDLPAETELTPGPSSLSGRGVIGMDTALTAEVCVRTGGSHPTGPASAVVPACSKRSVRSHTSGR